jgi:hypothetical protein
MVFRVACLLLVLGLAFGQPVSLAQDQPTCPDLEEGIHQVREAEFAAAAMTLDSLARRLGEQGGESKLLARTYVYLSIAYLGLSQVERAKTKFLEALEADEALDLSPSEFPPKYLEFFDEAREDAAAAQAASSEPPATPSESAASPEAAAPEASAAEAAAAPTESSHGSAGPTIAEATPGAPEGAPEQPISTAEGTTPAKKGRSKTLLIVGGVGAAAAAGVAVAGGGGGNDAAQSDPTPASTPRAVRDEITLLNVDPPSGSTITVESECSAPLAISFSVACASGMDRSDDVKLFVHLFEPDWNSWVMGWGSLAMAPGEIRTFSAEYWRCSGSVADLLERGPVTIDAIRVWLDSPCGSLQVAQFPVAYTLTR